ncbi:hypothetical protein [Qipengyuania spongiae]|uniref:ABC transporter permease n=1 Tax=Qipengyuania spongiae TaxID=2909673 RepID=A0ABY5SVS0_9SPHN|nr:hypothetical protein [Qipengyuania spongiae]UVI38395.1 hypothetical protein L1F33_08985 [Qipengyuania spongiae]
MIQLYKAELHRFARWGLCLAILHAIALFLLDRTFPKLFDDAEIVFLLGSAYGLVGAIFGFYQAANYARVNQWIALLHRPLAPWKIMASVIGASSTVLAASVTIPLFIFIASLSVPPDRVIDDRHWLLASGGALLALIGLGVGSYLALAPRRYGWSGALAIGALLVSGQGVGAEGLLLPLLLIVLLAVLVAGAFKPTRTLPPASPIPLAATVGVAGLSLYLLMVGASGLTYQLAMSAMGSSPEVDPPSGGMIEAMRIDSNDIIASGLETASTRGANLLGAGSEDFEAIRLPVPHGDLPIRGELSNSGPISFTELHGGIDWTYSHDRNALVGIRSNDGSSIGPLKPQDGFEAPPRPFDDDKMIAGGSLYRLDARSGVLKRLLQLPRDETILTAPFPAGPTITVLSDKSLYLLDRRAFEDDGTVTTKGAIPLPGPAGDLQRLDAKLLRDDVIVSFLFGRDSIDGPHAAWQELVTIDSAGDVISLARRSMKPDNPAFHRFRSYWISPAFRNVFAGAAGMGSGDAWIAPRAPVEVPRAMWFLAGILSLMATTGTVILARRRLLRPVETMCWALAALAFGIPLFTAFWLVRRA